jgi:hypothetical protein
VLVTNRLRGCQRVSEQLVGQMGREVAQRISSSVLVTDCRPPPFHGCASLFRLTLNSPRMHGKRPVLRVAHQNEVNAFNASGKYLKELNSMSRS